MAIRFPAQHPEEGEAELPVEDGVDDEVHAGVGQAQQVEEAVDFHGHFDEVVDAHADQHRGQADEEHAEDCQEELDALDCASPDDSPLS